ncbi:hypothetical protein [Litoribacter populi]|uniref:hypothetical protein n=1 Tax=Litoribacter populi TaxID=2598460 RepID=UPI00118009A1|nr:hypothetical protein [Litoribacter populi]
MQKHFFTLKKNIRLLTTFYMSFATVSLFISGISITILFFNFKAFGMLFWFKIFTSWLIIFFLNDDLKKEFYYFQNMGFSKRELWIWSMSFDFLVFIFLAYSTYLLT